MTTNRAKDASQSQRSPRHVADESFARHDAEELYGPSTAPREDYGGSYMPDDVTRDLARRMHFAAWRASRARDDRSRARWHGWYLHFRDRVVMGNTKLVYRAVRRWTPPPSMADDMAGDCQIVLIQAVAAYNPWMGIRFSTYAFTCLMRALSRLSQKQAGDRLARSLPLEALPDGEPRDGRTEDGSAGMAWVDRYLRADNEVLNFREKRVIARRFNLAEESKGGTLEQVGKELGLSKERVRQVQASALGKLRAALREESPAV